MSEKTKLEFIINGEKMVFTQETPSEDNTHSKTEKEKLTTHHQFGNKKDERVRNFFLDCYIDKDAIIPFLRRQTWVHHWAICHHDRDVNADKTIKTAHTHILLITYNAKTLSSVRKIFDEFSRDFYQGTDTPPQNTLGQIARELPRAWRYLIHADNPEKFQYSPLERYCDDCSYWNRLEVTRGMNDTTDNQALAILHDYMNGVHPLVMAERYGKDYIYHIKHYQNAIYEVYKAEMRANVQNNDIRQLMSLCLESSPFKDEQINVFWNVYDYIISQINTNYNSKIDFYLTESENINA